MSNNIYNILGNLAKLTPKEETPKEQAKAIYESVEAKGSISEGVSKIEQKLAEQLKAVKEAPAFGQQSDGRAVKPGQKFDTVTGKPLNRPTAATTQVGGTSQQDVMGDQVATMVQYRDAYAKRGDTQRAQYVQDQIRLMRAGQPFDKAFFGFAESVEEASYVHKGTYGTEYQGDADDEEEEQKKADAGKRGRGRPRKHAVKAKVAGRGRGRPAKEKKSAGDGGKSLQDLLIGKAPKKPTKGTLVKGRAMSHPDNKKEGLGEKAKNPYAIGMAQAEKMTGDKPPLKKSTIVKAHDIAKKIKANESVSKLGQRFITEGRMLDESGETLNHILNRFKAEVKQFEQGADLDQDLFDALFDYYFEAGEIPYGTAKGRTGDPYEWVTQRLDQELTGNQMSLQMQDEGIDPTNPRDYEIPAVQRKAAGQEPLSIDDVKAKDEKAAREYRRRAGLEEELNELAKLAGLDVNEAKKPDVDKDGVPDWADKKPGKDDHSVDKDEEISESCGTLSPMGSAVADMDADNLNVNTSYNSKDGRKSITVSAEGEMAEQLAQMLKLSGLAGGKPQQQQPEVKVVQLSPESAMEAKDYGDTEVDEAPEYANAPDQEVADVEAVTDQGNDLNRQKKQFAGKPKAGDNPMAEEFDPIEAMGRKLMREYESIKVQK